MNWEMTKKPGLRSAKSSGTSPRKGATPKARSSNTHGQRERERERDKTINTRSKGGVGFGGSGVMAADTPTKP